jgi:hypothetical protein
MEQKMHAFVQCVNGGAEIKGGCESINIMFESDDKRLHARRFQTVKTSHGSENSIAQSGRMNSCLSDTNMRTTRNTTIVCWQCDQVKLAEQFKGFIEYSSYQTNSAVLFFDFFGMKYLLTKFLRENLTPCSADNPVTEITSVTF